MTPAGEELAGSDLDGKVVAVQQGNIADIWVSNKDNCNPKEVKRYTKFAQAAEDLKNGKIDCIVMDQYPAEELVAANDTLTTLDGTLFEDKYAIAVKKGNKELLDEINKVIDKLVEEGKMKSLDANLITGKLMEPVSDDAVKIFSKADEYFQANIAKIITCEDEAAFEAQKQKMISDVLAMGYEKALAEVQEQFEKAKEKLE